MSGKKAKSLYIGSSLGGGEWHFFGRVSSGSTLEYAKIHENTHLYGKEVSGSLVAKIVFFLHTCGFRGGSKPLFGPVGYQKTEDQFPARSIGEGSLFPLGNFVVREVPKPFRRVLHRPIGR